MDSGAINRRDVFRYAFASALSLMATKQVEAGQCLVAPDCSAVCANGGIAKGDGTQDCFCFEHETPNYSAFTNSGSYKDLTNKPEFASVALSGSFSDLKNRPLRALSETDGGSALNARKFCGLTWGLVEDTSEGNRIPVIDGSMISYMQKSECIPRLPAVKSNSYTAKAGVYKVTVKTDSVGRPTGIEVSDTNCNCICDCNCNCCNCNCCNCGDDSAY